MKKEKTKQFLHVALGLALSAISSALLAQQSDSSKIQKIKDVVITATRTEQDPDSVGRSITLISMEQIRNSGATTLAEVLSQQEGIYVVGSGQTPGQIQNVFMRGANSNQTAIMIDGIRMTEASTADNAIELSEISLANIDHIEIVRGSHSTLYGSSAIGGVINIITKKGMKPGIHADADVRAGMFGSGTSTFTQDVFLNYSHKSGFYANGEVYNNNTKGLDATVDTVTNPKDYTHNHREKDGFNKTDVIGKIGYRDEKLNVFASYKRVQQKADIDAGAFTDDPAYTVAFTRNLMDYGASYKLNPHFSIAYLGAMTDTKRIALDDSSVNSYSGSYNHNYFKGTYAGSNMTNEIQANFQTKGIHVVLGGSAFNEKMTANIFSYNTAFGIYESRLNLDSLHINVNTISEFIHADIDGGLINDKCKAFSLGLGARNTKHDIYGSNMTYEINPSLRIMDKGLLFVSWSTGFNTPSLYQLYDPDQDPTWKITRGNPTLKPETATSMEIGFKQRVNENVSFHFSYFKTIVENTIDYVYLWNKNKPVDSLSYADYRGDTYINIGKQTTQGVEIGASSKLGEKVLVSGNVSLMSGKLDYDPSSINAAHTQGNQVQLFSNGAFITKQVESVGLVRRPSTANLSFTYKPIKNLALRADLRYAGPRSDIYYSSTLGPYGALATKGMSDYALLDISARYNIFRGLTAALRVANVFNEQYYEIYGYTTVGRSYNLNLRYSF